MCTCQSQSPNSSPWPKAVFLVFAWLTAKFTKKAYKKAGEKWIQCMGQMSLASWDAFPWHWLSAFSPSSQWQGPARQPRQWVRARLRNHLRHHELHSGGQVTQARDSAAFFLHLFNSLDTVLCLSGRVGTAYASLQSLSCPVSVKAGTHLCGQSCLSLFCLSRWCFHGSFTFYGSAVRKKRREKQEESRVLVLLNTM